LPPQFRRCKSRLTCVSNSIELEPEATKTPTIELFDIIDDEKTKEKHAANQFFSSLLGIGWEELLTAKFAKVARRSRRKAYNAESGDILRAAYVVKM
jgi:hypothetical protein